MSLDRSVAATVVPVSRINDLIRLLLSGIATPAEFDTAVDLLSGYEWSMEERERVIAQPGGAILWDTLVLLGAAPEAL